MRILMGVRVRRIAKMIEDVDVGWVCMVTAGESGPEKSGRKTQDVCSEESIDSDRMIPMALYPGCVTSASTFESLILSSHAHS
jgi:hypothetical protein